MTRTAVDKPRAAPREGCCDEVVAREVLVLEERTLAPTDWTHLQFCNAPAVEGTTKCPRHTERPNTLLPSRWRRFVRRWS